MIAEGVLEGADAIYGLHLWTPLPMGTVGSAPGPLMASADEFLLISSVKVVTAACLTARLTVLWQGRHL